MEANTSSFDIGSTRSSDMQGGEPALHWRQPLWLQTHQNISYFKSVRTFSDKKVVTSEKRRIDKMFCEQEKSVTLTKNTIGWSEDSYREGLRRGKFMQMKQEIQFVCVKKSSVARCERNQLLM